MKDDLFLLIWLVVDFIFGAFILAGCSYLVFWKGASGWLYLLAILFCQSPTLYDNLKRRFKKK